MPMRLLSVRALVFLCGLLPLGAAPSGCGAAGVDAASDAVPGERSFALSPTPLFDLAAIRDPSTADCRFEGARDVVKSGVALRVFSLSYLSWESIDGSLQPIRIRAFAARPQAATGRLPAVVQAHGLGGFAEEGHATSLAARLGMFAVAYSGPGSGTVADNTSEGRPPGYGSGYRMFDTQKAPDGVRGSWFWAHATAGLRALTCLEARSDVDASRLGMTGFSAGAVATLLGAGADDRIRAAVPLSGVLAWDEAVRSPAAWQHALLSQAGLDTTRAEWLSLTQELVDPTKALASSRARILLVNGTTDEFFPLAAHVRTAQALAAAPAGADARSSFIGNFDHGCYKLTGGESASVIEQRAALRADGGQVAWFRHHLAGDPAYPAIPRTPSLAATSLGLLTNFAASVDVPRGLSIEEVRVWWSGDDAFSFASFTLDRSSATSYKKLVPLPLTATTIYFVDVQYRTADWLQPGRFSLSSAPVLAPGRAPRIRGISTCL